MTPFFINKIPEGAEHYSRDQFFNYFVPGKEEQFLPEIQVVDTRVTAEDLTDWATTPAPSHLSEMFEIKDIQESSDSADALCSLSLFKMEVDKLHTGKSFQVYLDGLKEWIEVFRARRHAQKLRVYVGNSAWDDLYAQNVLSAKHVDFVRMSQSSCFTEIGVLWRFLAFDDYNYEYVYIEETDGHGDWVNGEWKREPPRYLGLRIMRECLSTPTGSAHFYGQLVPQPPLEFLGKAYPQGEFPFFFWVDDSRLSEPLFICRLSEYVRGASLVRGPIRLPFRMARMLAAHFQRGTECILYHPTINGFCNVRERHSNLNFRYIDDHWLFHLTKVLSVNFLLEGVHLTACLSCAARYGESWFVKRIYDNLIDDGNLFFRVQHSSDGVRRTQLTF